MSANAIARRYTKALVQLAVEENALEKFQQELSEVEMLLLNQPELNAVLLSPVYGVEEKHTVFGEIAAKLGLSETIRNFFMLILERNRLSCLPNIVSLYKDLADELSGVMRAVVTSALKINEVKVEEVKTALEKNSGKKVILKVEEDPALIGGIVTKIGNMVLDGSVKTQLIKIEDTLHKG
ncbi:MAG: ATP synthase F1 subunit delta [Desulfuromonadales bacterium]|nr:ATP synthase F1 subunit delta [Desulfuromonadales bacterium]